MIIFQVSVIIDQFEITYLPFVPLYHFIRFFKIFLK